MTQRTGRSRGRPPGSPNKSTIQKQRIAAEIAVRTMADAKVANRKLAKEHMQDFVPVLAGYCAYHQPTWPGMAQQNPNGNVKEFERWFGHFLDVAKAVAAYESPTFRAIDMRATLPQDSQTSPIEIMRSMLDEIDDESRTERAKVRQIEHTPPDKVEKVA